MPNQFATLRQTQLDPSATKTAPSPLRHGSTASTSSSAYSSLGSNPPSRTSTVSSDVSLRSLPRNLSHKRVKSDLVNMFAELSTEEPDAAATYESIRRSLRPLPQLPNTPLPATKNTTSRHARSRTVDETKYWKDSQTQSPGSRAVNHQENEPPDQARGESYAPRTPERHSRSFQGSPHTVSPHPQSPQIKPLHSPYGSPSSHPPPLTATLSAPDLETFQKSSTRHLRTLSKLAQSGESDDFTISNVVPSVVGLQGRRHLKRADLIAGETAKRTARRQNASAWTVGSWMDKQRQFLQAYEYLCHIGEAKEWIEEVVQKPIPPVVQLEEALRDGVTLAEVVQAVYPNRILRIFRHPRLQYRHSDNIALFFRFLDEVELPDIFRFELIDLYEKKNIPKVIHCIHALSWLLLKKGIVDIRMGNLVGQLEFEHEELEKTQKGLDKSGVSMPSFAGMAASFGAEPEPVESEEDRIQRELYENEAMIIDFQAQIKGAMLRLKLGNLMNMLWDFEPLLADLQSRLRGDWARQIFEYRLNMRNFTVNLQAHCRGVLVRIRRRNDEKWRKAQECNVLQLQSLIRGAKSRTQANTLRDQIRKEASGIKHLQAVIRGALKRAAVYDQYAETREVEEQVILLQAAIRGALQRKQVLDHQECAKSAEYDIELLQAAIRGALLRKQISAEYEELGRAEKGVSSFQAAIRGGLLRKQVSGQYEELRRVENEISLLQAAIKGALLRKQISAEYEELGRAEKGNEISLLQAAVRGALQREVMVAHQDAMNHAMHSVELLQAAARGMLTRGSIAQLKHILDQEVPAITSIQAGARAMEVRARQSLLMEALTASEKACILLQAAVRGSALRKTLLALRDELAQQTPQFITIQSMLRANRVRQFLDSQRSLLTEAEPSISDLQSMIRGFISRNHVKTDLDSLQEEEELIVELQSLVRAAISRIEVGDVLSQLEDCEDEVVELQALARAMLLRVDIDQKLSILEADEDVIVDLQACIRGGIVRSRFEERRRYYQENMEKVVKAQSFVRGRIQGQAYKSLTSGKNPPVGTVKGFVHLLNDSDFDFDEEIEFERLRKVVVQQVRQNELAEQYISQLDIKIALLVKNKITLDEVVKHQKHFGGHIGSLLANTEISSSDPFDLKALNKTSRRKLEQYQVLFFLLQTQSQYLARLFRRLRELNTSEKEYERIRHLMMGLFGYSQKRREEYYLIKLLARSSKEEIESFDTLNEYLRCNSFWNKLFASYTKSPRDRKFMRSALGSLVRESVIENPELDLESDPIQIYRSSINNEELRTGKRSRRQPDIPREEAIRDPETRATFIQHLQDLRDIADSFFSALEETLPRMPFGIRYISQQMYQCLLSRFSDENPGLILQVVGHWVWRNYFQPAIIEPEKYGVVDRGLTQEQKKNLAEVAKVVAQAASGRLFGTDNVYLQPLNSYVGESIQRLGQIWGDLISVQDAESYFDIDEFNDLYAKTKPTLYIKMADIFSIHRLVASEINYICPNGDDILKEIIRELGNVKTNENELMSVNTSEINLTLNPKLAQVEDPEADVKALFLETKRCILYIIRVQSGANLMEIMVKPPTEEDGMRWESLVRDELTTNNPRRGAYSEANLLDIGSMSYSELKRTALENILELERSGKISRQSNYQELLNAIAIDIRTKHRRRIQRQRELEGARLTLARLHDQAVYLEQQLKSYNDYIEQAMVTLQNKKGKKRFLMPFTKQWDHQRELQKSGKVFKFGSYKYSARNLADKGVLVYWKGYTERQWERADLTISSNEVGVFTIDGSSGNMMIPGANAQVPLDDLLQAQFNNAQFLDLFEGHLRVNVNLFLHLIMRKFYNE
ncbi:hypothetical protein MPDQ_004704 [Monascus purpureus]|uniref:Ras GTPase activating protein ira2 n=1 Tax=Monascus purpureus TaxID=5098 RepID=A0A507QLJ7_MONPU|nr:hypothetical protein MPDQ_004704 [Monascus purpureus]